MEDWRRERARVRVLVSGRGRSFVVVVVGIVLPFLFFAGIFLRRALCLRLIHASWESIGCKLDGGGRNGCIYNLRAATAWSMA